MADDIYGLLGANDLTNFQQAVQQSDPYGLAGRSLNAWQPDTRTWSPVATGATSFLKSFLSGYLGNMAQQNAAEQTNAVINVLPQLRQDPLSVATPEGVDENLFATIKGNAALRDFQRKTIQESQGGGFSDLMKTVLAEGVKSGKISPADAIQSIQTGNFESIINKPLGRGPGVVATSNISTDNPLSNGRDSTLQKTQSYYQQLVDSGMPEVQAASAAKEQVRGEIAANSKSFDEAKSAREYGQNLLSMANTSRAAMSQAGETGPLNPLAKIYEYAASTFGSKEATAQIAGDTLLNSVAPDVIQMARPSGGGATSDFESKVYLGSGPSTTNTPEGNALLVAKMEKLGKLNLDYADFLEAYREANAGSVVGASKKWSDYKQAFPIFIGSSENMEINENRPSWQEFFEARGSEPASADSMQARPIPTGQYTKSGKQVYIVNGVKGTID